MRLLENTTDFQRYEDSSVVTIGVFDGVHRGHEAIMSECVKEAERRGSASVVVTFDRNPRVLLDGVSPCVITPRTRKIEIIRNLGVDYMIEVEFDADFASLKPEDFCRVILREHLFAVQVCVGENFHFGAGGKGTVKALREFGRSLGFDVDIIPLIETDYGFLSSTLIRSLIREGRVNEVIDALGRPYEVVGDVVRGHDRGKALGFPTANLSLERDFCVPPDGVYAGRARLGEERYTCAINIGDNPTFGDEERALEVYLLEFEGEIYGKTMELEFHHRLRDEIAFDSEDLLIEQMEKDVEIARSKLEGLE